MNKTKQQLSAKRAQRSAKKKGKKAAAKASKQARQLAKRKPAPSPQAVARFEKRKNVVEGFSRNLIPCPGPVGPYDWFDRIMTPNSENRHFKGERKSQKKLKCECDKSTNKWSWRSQGETTGICLKLSNHHFKTS